MLKKILQNWHRYVIWALLSGIFWAWIGTRVAEAPAAQKVQLYADLPAMEREKLEIALEHEKPDGIRYVQAANFDYALFDSTEVLYGDLYLIPESKAEMYLSSFAPIDPAAFPGQTFYEANGKTYGIVVFDQDAGIWIGGEYVMYIAEERCFLFFNKESQHLGAWNNSADDAAIVIARNYLNLKQETVK